MEATTPAPSALVAATTDGASSAEGGSPKGGDLALVAGPAPGECLSAARYRLLHRVAVSFMSSDIRVFFAAPPFLLCHLTSASAFFYPPPTAAPPRAVVP